MMEARNLAPGNFFLVVVRLRTLKRSLERLSKISPIWRFRMESFLLSLSLPPSDV